MITLRITEYSGAEYKTEVETFNIKETFLEMQAAMQSNNHFILIGDVIMDARSIKSVNIVPEPEPAPEEPVTPEVPEVPETTEPPAE